MQLPIWQIVVSVRKGATPAELVEAYPELTLAAVHSALAYYYNHREEVDAETDENRPEAVMAWLRGHSGLIEERGGVYRGKRLDERSAP